MSLLGGQIVRHGSEVAQLLVGLLSLGLSANAANLLIGNDTQGPVTIYTTTGTFVQNFGQSGATGSAVNAAGHIFTELPGRS